MIERAGIHPTVSDHAVLITLCGHTRRHETAGGAR